MNKKMRNILLTILGVLLVVMLFKFCGVVRDKSQLGSQDPGRLGSSV